MTITKKSTILLTDDAHRIQIVENTAYIANWIQGGLQIWNVDPGLATPTFLGKYVDATSKSRGVQVVGNLAYVADQEFGLKVINISTPSAPTLVGNYDTPGTAYRVKVVGNKAYVADSTSGVQIIDVTTPSGVPTPVLPPFLGNAPTTDARTTDVAGNYLYVADYTSGLKIFNASSPFSPVGSLTSVRVKQQGIKPIQDKALVF